MKLQTSLLLCAAPAALFAVVQFAGRADAGSTELNASEPQAIVLGGDDLRLSGAELERLEPFVMQSGEHAGTSVDRALIVRGEGFYGTAFGPFVQFDGADAPGVEILDDETLRVYVPQGLSGSVSVEVRVSDGRSQTLDTEL